MRTTLHTVRQSKVQVNLYNFYYTIRVTILKQVIIIRLVYFYYTQKLYNIIKYTDTSHKQTFRYNQKFLELAVPTDYNTVIVKITAIPNYGSSARRQFILNT